MTLTIDYAFRRQIQNLNFSLNYCYQCATCSGGCPIAKLTEGSYNPRKIIEAAILGLKDYLVHPDSQVWLCLTCQKCVEQCPQGVELTHIFDHIKNLCVQSGNIPEAYKSQASVIYETAMAIPFSEPILKRREKLELPLIKMAEPSELQTLMKDTEFQKKFQIQPSQEPIEQEENK